MISELFMNVYYSDLKVSEYKIFQTVDVIHNKQDVYVILKRSHKGYLLINKEIADMVKTVETRLGEYTIEYIVDNHSVQTKSDVLKVTKLKKKDIRSVSINIDDIQQQIVIRL